MTTEQIAAEKATERIRMFRVHQYKGHNVAAVDNGDGTYSYSIDGQVYETRQKSCVQARQLAAVRIDSKGFTDEPDEDEEL